MPLIMILRTSLRLSAGRRLLYGAGIKITSYANEDGEM